MIARRIRDLVRGLLGTYVIEQRLVELRDAVRDSARPGNLDLRINDPVAGRKELEAQIKDAEARLQRLTDLVAHTVVRDVGIIVYLGFPSYFFGRMRPSRAW